MGRTRAIQPNITTTLPPGDSLTINNKGFATISLGLYEMEPETVPPTFAERWLSHPLPIIAMFTTIALSSFLGGPLFRYSPAAAGVLALVGLALTMFCMWTLMDMARTHRSLRVKYFIKTGEQP